jgi:3-oxoacyl-[acyl-carrier-protein] synthase-1
MKPVYIVSDNIISPLGFSTGKNIEGLMAGCSGIEPHSQIKSAPTPFYGSLMDPKRLDRHSSQLNNEENLTRFEKLILLSVENALKGTRVRPDDESTLMILCTTKGNIDQLGRNQHDGFRLRLWESAKVLQQHFNNPNKPIVISNACISGLLGIITGSRILSSSPYKHVIVSAGDIISDFVIAGFHSLKTISPFPCKPYDLERRGLTLGEGAGTMILSTDRRTSPVSKPVQLLGGAVSNDAHHVTSPSRTGIGLCTAIVNALSDAGLKPNHIDHISAHGTATPYNDEMESLAVAQAGLGKAPLNSLKGYFGHTLGAAGMIESIVAVHSMREQMVLGTKGFENIGVTGKINITARHAEQPIRYCLKIASGFGGCNAGAVFGMT